MRIQSLAVLIVPVLLLNACDSGVQGMSNAVSEPGPTPVTASGGGSPAPRSFTIDAMVYAGPGTWGVEVTNLENILNTYGATWQQVTNTDLDAMSAADLAQFGVLIFPGGEGSEVAENLSTQTHANLREAVQNLGVSYVGFCAGAFVAVAPAPEAGQDVSYGFGVVNADLLDTYYLDDDGVDYEMTEESFASGQTLDILWYGGPVTPNMGVIAKYPNGQPAISEMMSGQGFVVLSGVHPTASASTLSGLGMVSNDGTHQDIAWELINAALTKAPLTAF